VFYGVQQGLSLRQSLWLLSLTAAALAAVVYHGRRTGFTRAALIAAVAVTLATAGNGVFGLLGPNGAGKTTLLRCLATAMDADGGRLRLLGYDPSDHAERRAFRRRLGYLPQHFGYYPNFTVWEFVEYFALLKEIPASETPQKVAQAIRRVGLEDRAGSSLGRCPAACSDARASRRLSSTSPRFCCWTSRPRGWIRSSG
jgi:ABC-type Fe3+/spermidine/putrescine transport system ATPase subunit